MDDKRLQKIEALLDINRVDEAQQQLMSLAAENPDNAFVHGQMCRCHLMKGEFGKALEMANKVVSRLPDSGYGHYLRGVSLSQMDINPSKAEEAFRQALALDPFDADYHGAFAAHMLDRGKHSEAFEMAEKGLSFDAEHEQCRMIRMAAASITGRKGEAEHVAKILLNDAPDSPDVHAQVGWTALRTGDHRKAREHFCTALNLDPENDGARSGLITSIKATNPIYKLLLGWIFLCQRLGNYALLIIFGLIFVRRSLNEITEAYPALGVVLTPVSWVLTSFVLLTWVGDSVANFLLLLHPQGRHALTAQDKWTSFVVCGLLAAGLTLAIMGLTLAGDYFIYALIIGSFSLLATSFTGDLQDKRTKIQIYAALGVFLVGLAAIFFGNANAGIFTLYLLAFIGFTWFSGIASIVRR